MQKFDIYKFLRILFLILAIISMIFAICGRVRAAEPYDGVSNDPYNINSLSDALDYMNITLSQKQTILDAFEQYCPYYQIYFDNDYHSMAVNGTDVPGQYITCPFIDLSTWRCSGMYYLAKSDITPTYVLVCRIYGSSVQLYFKTPGAQGNYMTVFNSEFQSLYGSDQTFLQYYDNTGDVLISGDVSPECAKDSLFCYSVEGQHVFMQDNRSYVRPLGEDPLYGFPDSHKFIISPDSSLDASEDIDIDKTYVDGALGIRVKWSVLPFPESGSFNYAGYTSITLDFDCDGSVLSVTLDSDDYPELFSNFDTSLPNNGSAYIPWSMVQKVKRLLQYADYDVISCTGCSITMSGYPSGSPSSASSEYTMVAVKDPPLVLKGQSYVDTPEFEAASVTTAADRPTSVEEGSTYQSNAFSYAHSFFYSSSDFSTDDIPICSWADYKIVVFDNPTSSSEEDLSDDIVDALPSPINPVRGFLDKDYFNSLISKFGIMISGVTNDSIDIVDISSGNPSSLTYSDVLSLGLDDLLHDNSFSSYFDILIFVYHSDQDYVCVYYSDRYFTRLQFRAFEDLQTVLEADAYYMKNTYLLLDAVVSNIDSNLVDFFTSSLDVDSKMLFYLDSMNIKFDDLDRSVTSGTASIVAALNDLDTFDDTRIYNKLVELTGYIQALQTADSVNNSNTTILGQILAAINDIEYPDPDTAPDWVSALLEFLGDLLDLLNSLSSDGITVTLSDSNEPDTPQEYGFNLEIPDWSFSDSGFSVDQASLSGYEEDPIMQQLITELASDFFDKLKPVSYQLLDLMYENIEFDESDDYDDSFTNANIAHFFGGYRRPAAGGEASSFFFFFTDQYDPYEYDGIVQND